MVKRRAVIAALVIVLIPLVVALVTRPAPDSVVSRVCFLRSHTEPYWSADYCREFSTAPDNGRWLHLDHGFRYTVPVTKPTIYMLGNSTMWGTYVLDEDTIPSQLQQLIGDTYRVVNRGQPGATVAYELDDVLSIRLHPQDIVVMYDGMEWFKCQDSGLSSEDATDLRRYLITARAYTTKAGALWFHALQPSIMSGTLRPDEAAMVDASRGWLVCPYAERVWRDVLPGLQAANVGADFTFVLDAARASGAVLYVDPTHLNKDGNAIIARAIWNELTIF